MGAVERQPTCAERVAEAWQSRRDDLRLMLHGPDPDDCQLIDDGTLDTVVRIGDEEFRYESAPDWMVDDTEIHTWFERDRQHVELRGVDTQETIVQWWDEDVAQAVEDGFLDPQDWHGSAVAYAEEHDLPFPRRFDAGAYLDDEGDTVAETLRERFYEYGLAFDYVAPGTFTDQVEGYWRYQISWGGPSEEIRFYSSDGQALYKAEFWFLDWFDGAHVHVLGDDVATAVWDWFVDVGVAESARCDAEG